MARVSDIATGTKLFEVATADADTLTMNRAQGLLGLGSTDTKIWNILANESCVSTFPIGVQVQTAPRGCTSVVQRVALTDNSGAFTLTGLPGGCIAWVGLRAADRVASPERSAARFLASDDARADNMVLVAVPTPATNKRVEVPARPAADEAHVRSANSAVASDLSFENTRDESVLVYWIDESGTRRFYVRIGSKRTISMGTFVDHAWVITDDHDKALVVFVPTTRLAHATIR